ncbi:calmodulin-A-like [Schistocerca gregaria]|uniref:calmodulin-A-like n=1 Tax=Schistocerca gregaria TaxID=7010 RepID=UPI00211F1A8B|nr:calmodulin-A-like [Schistocerca gregaria]
MVDTFSPELIAEYKEAFSYFDSDSDGWISSKELGLAMRSLGHCVTEKELNDMVNEFGAAHDEKIEFTHFLLLIKRQIENKDSLEETIRKSVKIFDRNDTGLINASQLRHALTTLGEKLTTEEVDSLFKEIDINADGMIDREEFVQALLRN